MFTRYAVEIGDSLWTALYSHVENTYGIESVCESEGQKFAVLTADDKYYRLDFSIAEDGVIEFAAEATLLEDYVPGEEPQFSADAVAEYAKSKKKKDDEEKEPEAAKTDDGEGEEEKCPKCGKPKSECECEGEDEDDEKKKKGKKDKYNLEEIQEYVELSEKYSALETTYSEAQQKIADLESQISELTAFKKKIEKAEKEKMIESFYMLSDDDKADVVANIDTYSLDDIEAKLSIICVRNKVSFNLDDDKGKEENPVTYNLGGEVSDEGVPAWIKSLRAVASEMK